MRTQNGAVETNETENTSKQSKLADLYLPSMEEQDP